MSKNTKPLDLSDKELSDTISKVQKEDSDEISWIIFGFDGGKEMTPCEVIESGKTYDDFIDEFDGLFNSV